MTRQKMNSMKATDSNGYLKTTRRPLFAFVVTSPLLLLYNLAYVFDTNIKNGVDFLSRFLFRYTGYTGFLLVNLGLLLASVVAGIYLKRRGKLSLKTWGFVVAEGTVYGIIMGKTVVLLMQQVHLLSTTGPIHMSPAMDVLMAAGAGYHEELVFRLIPLELTLWLLRRFSPGRKFRYFSWVLLVVLTESALFSLAHFMGLSAVSWYAFWFRFFAGIIFSILFLSRGFAVAAYSHFLYDVMVMLF